LDEDFPGNLGFAETEITATRNQDKVEITVTRTEGTDGKVSCMIKTEPFVNISDGNEAMASQNAQEFDDYLPRQEEVVFENGESE
jgi:hypothetical protein